MKILKFAAAYFVFACLLSLPPLFLKYACNGHLLISCFWVLFFFIALLTLLVILLVLLVQHKNSAMYAQAFLGGTTFKLLACLVFILVFIRKIHPDKTDFIIDFMYLYLLNTAFEIYGLLHNLRNQNLK